MDFRSRFYGSVSAGIFFGQNYKKVVIYVSVMFKKYSFKATTLYPDAVDDFTTRTTPPLPKVLLYLPETNYSILYTRNV
jgi:hypothetical protein